MSVRHRVGVPISLSGPLSAAAQKLKANSAANTREHSQSLPLPLPLPRLGVVLAVLRAGFKITLMIFTAAVGRTELQIRNWSSEWECWEGQGGAG